MKYQALVALIGSASAGGTCTFDYSLYSSNTCANSPTTSSETDIAIGTCIQDDTSYYKIIACDADVGLTIYTYSDAACTTGTGATACPKDTCCAVGDGSNNFKYVVNSQWGSKYGLSAFGAWGEIFATLFSPF